MTKYLMVAIGGALGSVLRFWVGTYVSNRLNTRFLAGTFVVNMTACFLIGFVVTVLAEKSSWNPNWRYLIPIGFIGGYSTFSTFEYETFRVFQEGELSHRWIERGPQRGCRFRLCLAGGDHREDDPMKIGSPAIGRRLRVIVANGIFGRVHGRAAEYLIAQRGIER